MRPRVPALPRWARAALLVALVAARAGAAQVKEPFVTTEASGALVYRAEENGDRMPDFSTAGYGGGGVPLPSPPARLIVYPSDGDDGDQVQAAIDQVSALAPDADGWRGAVYLAPGRYDISGQLRITASGVVLRGAGSGDEGTILVATGTGRRALVQVTGEDAATVSGARGSVTDAYVPVGAKVLTVDPAEEFTPGQRIRVEQQLNEAWVRAVGMAEAPARTTYRWRADDMILRWERTVVASEAGRLQLDAPVTSALDPQYGTTTVRRVVSPGRAARIGIEHLRCISAYDANQPKDEDHAWMAITLDRVENAWVADVVAVHFVSSAVHVGAEARAVTVQDCASLAPVSEDAGYRRHAFHTAGQQTLFQRCRSEDGRNDFTVGYLATGPNVFLECEAVRSTGFSGSIGSWASGILFDNVSIDGGALALDNLETWNGGVGWAAANSVIWQCSASILINRRPPTAQNWAVGVWGQFVGDGWWDQVDEFVRPESLYRAQLAERAGREALAALDARVSKPPAPGLAVASPAARGTEPPSEPAPRRELQLRDGWLVEARDGAVLHGSETPITWWRGSLLPGRAATLGPNVTRFAPGREGPGLTDDLRQLVKSMRDRGSAVLRHHYGLWYDRRRDDHQRMRRASADAWPPFYEQPWARSGQGEAADRLSRYDLTRFNPWYFSRLREFAELGRRHGVVLVNEMYFQHNILESGAHWVDSPWRPINALQDTGFPEPPPFTGDTVKVADWFYDVSHPVRRELHRAYIRQCLQNLADQPNVVHTTSAEFSGPRHFVEFWLDVVAEWQAETGHDPLIALSAPKDVQDAMLADERRGGLVDVIDLTYWWYTDTELYAPRGGENLAPRQHLRKWRGGPPSADSLARMVSEYRLRFPGKAVTTGLTQPNPWAYVAAGGSWPALPAATDSGLRAALAEMQPRPSTNPGAWRLQSDDGSQFVVVLPGRELELDLRHDAQLARIDPTTGQVQQVEPVPAGRRTASAPPSGPALVLWIQPVTR